MCRITSWLAVSALAIGGFTFVPSTHAADPVQPASPNDTGRVGTPTNNSGAVRTDTNTNTGTVRTDTNTTEVRKTDNGNNANAKAPDADDIRKTMAKVAEDAVTKDDFKKLAKNLVDADYDRVKDFKSADNFATLNGRIDQFNKDWKAKYNEDFGFSHRRNDVLNDSFAQIIQGEIGEARTAGGKEMPSAEPQNVKGGTPKDLEKSGVNQPDANSNKTFGGETNREPGRNVATVIIKGSAQAQAKVEPGQPITAKMETQKELNVAMIHEMPDSWKIDIPDSIDGQKLYDNLLKHLTMVDEDHANWPADKNEAYRLVTRHIMEAMVDTGS
jgi:hypothetical protein